MHQPKKWWVGLIPLAAVFFIAVWRSPAPVEADLTARAAEEFKRSGLDWAKASLVGRDVVVEGVAPEPEARALALSAAQRTWGVRRVTDKTTVLPEQKPYAVSAARDGAKIILTGSVASDAARAAGIAAAKAAVPTAEVTDQRTLARGAPATYAAGLAHGLAQLGKLTKGTAGLSDSALSVTGSAADFAGFDAVTAALKTLPAGVSLAKAEIGAPRVSPFEFNAVKAATGITLSGFIPAESARAGILSAARAVAGSGTVTDQLRVAEGAPAGVDFGQATGFGLAQLGRLTGGTAKLSDQGLSVTGSAADFAGFDAVTAALKALPAGVSLAKAEIGAPRVSPFEFNAVKAAAGITLSGVIPAESARAGLLAAARAAAGSGTVTDQLRVAVGAPAGVDFGPATSFALAQLGRLSTGTAKLSDQSLSLTGQAATVPVHAAVTSALAAANLPGAVKLASQAISGPTQAPYTWSAKHDAAGVTLAGFAPSETVRGAIVNAAKGLFPGVNVIDQMQLALGAPNGFANAVNAGLALLQKLPAGVFSLTDALGRITGEAANAGVAEQIRSALANGLAPGFRGDVAGLTVRPPPPLPPPPPAPPVASAPAVVVPLPPVVLSPLAQECQDKFNQMLAKEKILFASGRADIQEESNALIKALAEESRRCPAAHIDVQGHTDSDGVPEANKALSERRSAAVLARLADFGVEKTRLSATGFGETRPIAGNDTPENKAKNRRIEFVVSE